MGGGFYFYLHLYRFLYLYLLKNRLKPHQIMVSGESLGKDSTLDERSGLDNFVLMLRPGWTRHQTDLVEARVSKINQKSFKFERRHKMRHGGKRAGAGRPIGSTSLASPEQRQ